MEVAVGISSCRRLTRGGTRAGVLRNTTQGLGAGRILFGIVYAMESVYEVWNMECDGSSG